MTPKTLLARDPALLSEAQWSSVVADVARLGGWELRYHTLRSKGSASGFPDWVFWHPGRSRHADEGHLQPELVFAELKSESGKLTPAQQVWIEKLGLLAECLGPFYADTIRHDERGSEWNLWHPVRVFVWRPSDYDDMAAVLTGRDPDRTCIYERKES